MARQLRCHAHYIVAVPPNDLDLRCPFDEVDVLLEPVGQHDAGVADQCHDRGSAVDSQIAGRVADLADGPRDLRIGRRQRLVVGDARQRDLFGLSPSASPAPLLERTNRTDPAVFPDADFPQQARRSLIRIVSRLACRERQQRGQRRAPRLDCTRRNEPGRRLAPLQHSFGCIDLRHQRREPATRALSANRHSLLADQS